MSTFSFDTDYAKKYGVNEAIIISNFQFWITKNKTKCMHKYSERHWTFNSIEALGVIFCFWSTAQIRRVIESLIDQNVLCHDRFNKAGYDKTMWYAFINESEFIEDGFLTRHTARTLHQHSYDEINKSFCQNHQMEATKLTNGCGKTNKPIPNNKPDEKQDSKPDKTKEVFVFWKKIFNKRSNTTLTNERQTKITQRLKKYSVEDIKQAITNCSLNSFNVENGHIDLTLICRNDTMLEKYRDMTPKQNPKQEQRYARHQASTEAVSNL